MHAHDSALTLSGSESSVASSPADPHGPGIRRRFLPVLAVVLLCLSTLTAASLPLRVQPPLVVAHRAGSADAPENTIPAIEKALDERVDMIWLSVQVSSDGVPVLYRPTDLSALTNSTGPVSSDTAAQLAQIDAGWAFTTVDGRHPYRGQAIGIPTVAQALQLIPTDVEVIFDVKTHSPQPVVPALMNAVTNRDAWSHVLFYSTQQDVHDAMSGYSKADVFEARDATRHRLLQLLLTGVCDPPAHSITWVVMKSSAHSR